MAGGLERHRDNGAASADERTAALNQHTVPPQRRYARAMEAMSLRGAPLARLTIAAQVADVDDVVRGN